MLFVGLCFFCGVEFLRGWSPPRSWVWVFCRRHRGRKPIFLGTGIACKNRVSEVGFCCRTRTCWRFRLRRWWGSRTALGGGTGCTSVPCRDTRSPTKHPAATNCSWWSHATAGGRARLWLSGCIRDKRKESPDCASVAPAPAQTCFWHPPESGSADALRGTYRGLLVHLGLED